MAKTPWEKRVQIDDAVIYLGDARKIIPALSSEGIRLICSDLPYKLTNGGGKTGKMGGKFSRENYPNDGNIIKADIKFEEYMSLLAEIMPQGHAYFMVNNRHVGSVENAAKAAGFRFHNWLVWDKVIGTQNRWYMKNVEFTLFVFRGEAVPINDCSSAQLLRCPGLINAPHPTQKPVEVMENYIRNSSQRGDVVFDPFMGSGSTGIAALNLGRRFVGIEIDEKWFDLAEKRLRSERNVKAHFEAPVGAQVSFLD